MKIRIIAYLLIFYPILLSAQEVVLDLNRVIDEALINNFQLRQVYQDLKIAKWTQKIALSAYFPQLSFLFTATRYQDHPFITYKENYEYTVSLSQSILNIKQLSDIRSSSFYTKFQHQNFQAYKQYVIYEGIQLFYLSLLSQENLRVRERAYNLAKEQKRIAEIRYKEGMVSYYDLLRAETNLLTAQAEYKKASAQYEKSLDELRHYLGYAQDVNITLKGNFEFESKNLNINKILQQIGDSPHIQALNYLVKKYNQDLNSSRSEFLPTLTLELQDSAGKQQAFASGRKEWDDYWAGYLKVSFPIFEGGRRFFQVNKAREELKKVKIQRDELISEIKKNIDSLYQDYLTAQEVVKSQKENLVRAEELHQLVKERYINGEASEIEFLDAYLNLISTQLAYKQALYDVITSYYGILYYAGIIDQEVRK